MSKNTIDDHLYNLVWFHVIEANPLMDIRGWSIEQRNAYVNEHMDKFNQALYQDLMDILKKYKSAMWSIEYKDLENEINQYFKRGEK